MPDVQHSVLTDPNLHEPKGTSTANSGQIYVANGAGSGTWMIPEGDDFKATGQQVGKLLTPNGTTMSFTQNVWNDILGVPIARTAGGTAPTWGAYRGGQVKAYSFAANDEVAFIFHMPHDYAPGTDLYLHAHWGHNGTAISGDMVWTYYATYAKGHNQANFSAEVTGTITYSTVNISTTPQYRHRIDEIQLSAATPSGSQLDTDNLEVDGVIMINLVATTIPTITGGSPNEPFLFELDLHYLSGYDGTLNKVPNFYA